MPQGEVRWIKNFKIRKRKTVYLVNIIIMKTKTHFLHFFLILLSSFSLKANLRPVVLTLEINAPRTRFTTTEIIQINVSLKNCSANDHSILVPGSQSKGLKLIYFSWFKVDDKNFYTEVYRDSRVIFMDTSLKGSVNFNQLNPNESTIIPFFFNDTTNAKKHINSNYNTPKLIQGKYKIVAWYYPWDEELAKYVFSKYDWKSQDEIPIDNPELMDLPESGIVSPYFDVEIIEQSESNKEIFTNTCGKGCGLCKAIENENWRKTKRLIRLDSKDINEYNMGNDSKGNWKKAHRNIAYLGDNPDAILASLPSFLTREIIFKNKNGIHYFYLTWQLGKISRVKSRMNTLFYVVGLRKLRLKDSKLRYSKLKYLSKS